ncbi:uncharacterized protein LOC115620226 isoform X2 [Scaptodrosophila lebanonensis]|nr:uncharacterized protein LOC115620226 isoform X2 [Scaptodrosophila lebanonensis]
MRRRPTKQGSIQHRQMQERIIEENKRKWLNRPEPKREINAPGVIYQLKNPLYAAEKIHLHHGGGAGGGKNRRGQGDDKAAEEYSRRRRAQRLKELKRQERELQKSRRGYKFPRAEGDSAPEGRMKDNVSQQETEAQYWHSWQTCPDERRMFKTEEEMSDAEPSSGYGKTDAQQPGLVRPPHPYDGSRRRFQTASLQQAARLDLAPKALEERAMWRTNGIKPPSYDMRVKRRASRKLTSMEKQYQLAYDLTDGHKRRRSSVADAKVQQSQIKMPMPQKMWRNPVPDDDEVELIDMELPHQPPRKKMSWNGMPQWWHKRFNKGKRSRSNDFEDAAEERDEAPKVKPPRYRMTVQSKALKRMRVPVQSFSERLRIVPRNTPHSEYTGYSRPTVCDQWESFKSGMISKSIY